MFVGSSEISIGVIVKHVQHIGIIRALFAWGDLLYFSVAEGTVKIAGLWFPSGDQYPGWHFEDVNKPQTSMSKYIEKKTKVVLKEQLL